jgi:single-stranded-DNA-specific exonuclease
LNRTNPKPQWVQGKKSSRKNLTKRWVVLPKKSESVIEQLLINRHIEKEDWDSFLNPDFEKGLHDPLLMKGMKEAVARIEQAVLQKEIVGIFGDYDADGIPGLALLYDLFSKLELKVVPYIPSRSEGYGLNKEGIDIFAKAKVTLMVTVDLGIRSFDQVGYAKENGIETIILDHHEPGEKIPDCIVVNPKQKGDKYPFCELSGCGVAFKLAQALSKKFNKINIPYLKWLLDLVAISTICDIVPLVDENRIFAKFGLIVLRKTKRIGLLKLYQAASIEPEKIDTYTVGFQIGPRLNAPGRMAHANQSFYLLISKDPKEATALAAKLDQINRLRQSELDRVLKSAKEKVIQDGLDQKKVIIVSGRDWPHGIIGLVAGKLMEEYARPVIVCEKREKDFRGSARSIDGYNIIEALEESNQLLTSFGGHAKAAGLTFELSKMESLYDQLLQIAAVKLKDKDLVPKIKIEAKISEKEITNRLLQSLKKLEPFGLGNPRPVFTLENIKATDVRTVGREDKHLSFKVGDLRAIAFDLAAFSDHLKNQVIDLAFTIDEDTWGGESKPQLKIVDIKNE